MVINNFMPMSRFRLILIFLVPLLAHGEEVSHIEDLTGELPESMRENLIITDGFDDIPFNDGEVFHYKLGWGFFSVASSRLTTELGEHNGQPAWHISLKTRTNSFADAFYKVRNFSQTWIAPDVSQAVHYENKQREGKRKRDVTVTFDWENNTARYVNTNSGDRRDPVDITRGTFDPVSIVFFVRALDFEVGDELVIPTTNGKEFFYTVVHVTDKVTRKFSIGKREAWVLKPDIKDIGGVFKKSNDGEIVFYFSADEHKLPLRMESKVSVGSFWAELDEVENGEPQKSQN